MEVVSFLWAEGMANHTMLNGKSQQEMHALTAKGGMYVRDMIYETSDGQYITVGERR